MFRRSFFVLRTVAQDTITNKFNRFQPERLGRSGAKWKLSCRHMTRSATSSEPSEGAQGREKRSKRRAASPPRNPLPQSSPQPSFPMFAYATCEELDLSRLKLALIHQDLYQVTTLSDDMSREVIHVTAKYKINDEEREAFFFRQGVVVFLNMQLMECSNALTFLKPYERVKYPSDQVKKEYEYMKYSYTTQGATRLHKGSFVINIQSPNQLLEKYALANAVATSVKLGIWESTLDKFVTSIDHLSDELKTGENLHLSREDVLKKIGELFCLRHDVNLSSDLLDLPDFYWEREQLEMLYVKTYHYLNINRRTKVLNEKLSQCWELLELISTHLTDRHHTRLEWMIIALIAIEVGFEVLHVIERYS